MLTKRTTVCEGKRSWSTVLVSTGESWLEADRPVYRSGKLRQHAPTRLVDCFFHQEIGCWRTVQHWRNSFLVKDKKSAQDTVHFWPIWWNLSWALCKLGFYWLYLKHSNYIMGTNVYNVFSKLKKEPHQIRNFFVSKQFNFEEF